MAIIAKQQYNQDKIDKLRDYLRLYYDKGMPIDYEILVDGFKAVRRTNDPELFNMFESFVTADTRTVEILFYTGTSNNNDKHLFSLSEEPKEVQGLSGIEIDNRIQEGIEREKRNWEFEALRKENKELKEEIEDLEDELERVEKERDGLVSKQSPLNGLIGEVGSSMIESFVRRNPKVIANLPGGHALAGLIEDESKAEEEPLPDVEVSFKAKNEDGAKEGNNSSHIQQAVAFVNQLKSSFTKEEFDQILEILQYLAENKESIEMTLELLKPKEDA